MDPEAAIAALDRAVAAAGTDFTIRRVTEGVYLDSPVRGAKRGRTANALSGNERQEESTVAISISEVRRRQWCWPLLVGDFLIDSGGRHFSVEHVDPIELDGTIVRYDLRVRG